MPTITPALIPSKSIGNLFSSLTGGDSTLNIRWLEPTDPVFYEVLNRPTADMAVRQLVVAKAVDSLAVNVGRQSLFPFIVQPIVSYETTALIDIPVGLIWDMSVSLPAKWRNVRLAKIQRISGTNNPSSDTYTGDYRFIFSGITDSDSSETYIFYADYKIDSTLFFQPVEVSAVKSDIVVPAISTGDAKTISGWITFRTMSQADETAIAFYNALAPSGDLTGGYYINPATYELVDTPAGGINVTDDFSTATESHGTGFLTEAAWNSIPSIGSDLMSWLESSNYPFGNSASLISADDTIRTSSETSIPIGLFKEFNILIPEGDGPAQSAQDGYFTTFISSIERVVVGDSSPHYLKVSISTNTSGLTYAVVGTFNLYRSYVKDQIVPITPTNTTSSNTEIGRGHVVLSDLWTSTSAVMDAFFNKFELLPLNSLTFTSGQTRLSAFGISRTSKLSLTQGQADALAGTTSTLTTPVAPSGTNRFVTEADQGLGNAVDFTTITGILPHVAIENVGYTGALTHKIVRLVVDSSAVPNDPNFYANYVLPRLTKLLGRPPAFSDGWYNGVRFMWYNGDSWQG